jgi:hypothetical protein
MKGDNSDVYRVDWQNTSAEDGDSTLGAFVFAVDPSGTSDKVESATTIGTTGGSSSSSVAPVWAVLIGILGLVVGAGGTYAATRSRAGASVGAK